MAISKMVQSRLSSARIITTALNTHSETLSQEIHKLLIPYLQSGETLSKEDVKLFLSLFGRHFDALANTMQKADEEHNRELGEDTRSRQVLSDATTSAYDLLRDLKQTIRVTYGEEVLEEIQIQGKTPTDYQALFQQYQLVMSWLSNKSKTFPTALGTFSSGLNKATVLSKLQPAVKTLDDAINAFNQDKKETEGTMLAKNNSIDAYDRAESQTSNVVSAFLSMSGLDEEARRLRPSKRRSKTSDDTETQENTTVEPTSSTETPSTES